MTLGFLAVLALKLARTLDVPVDTIFMLDGAGNAPAIQNRPV